MALHTTRHSLWMWSSIIVVFSLFQTPAAASEKPEIILQNCCFKEITNSYTEIVEYEDIGGGGSCQKTISVDWNVLKSFRIPRDNAIVPVISNETALVVNQNTPNSIECGDSLRRYTVPSFNESLRPSKGFLSFFSEDGYFQFDEHIYHKKEYCIQRVSDEAISVFACSSKTLQCSSSNMSLEESQQNLTETETKKADSKTCLVRCCDYGEVWDVSAPSFRCITSGEKKWKPKIFSDVNDKDEICISRKKGPPESHFPVSMVKHPRYLVKTTCLGKKYTFQSPNVKLHQDANISRRVGKRPFKVLKDGSVWMKLRKREWIQLQSGEYCLDGFQYGPGSYSGDNSESLLFECKVYETAQEQEGKERQRKYSLVFGILLVFCLCFLLLTTLVYILLWSTHNLKGWIVFCYILALLATYLCLGISHFSSIFLVRETSQEGLTTFCGVIGVLCHFTFLSAFSWSTVLNFDLWCTFRRNLRPSGGKSKGLKKFLIYCVFAVLCPGLIVGTGILLDIYYRDDQCNDIITPEYGKSVCFVEPKHARVYYFLLPLAVFMSINFVFFLNTAFAVYKVKKAAKFASSSSTKNDTKNETFRLILKLMLVNGSIWIVEILSWYLQTDYEEVGLLSFLLDVFNVLQAVAIFFLFVFKNNILNALKKNYPKLGGTVDIAFRLKNLGSTKERTTASTADSSCHSKSNANNVPVPESDL